MKNLQFSRNKILEFLVFYLTIGIVFPAFKSYTNIPAFWPAVTLLILYCLISYPSVFIKKTVIVSFVIIIILLLQLMNRKFEFWFPGLVELQHRFYAYFVSSFLLEVLIKYNNKEFNIRLGKFTLSILGISVILQIISEINFPLISRLGADAVMAGSYPWWVITLPFGVLNALAFIIGMIIFVINPKKIAHMIILFLFITLLLIAGFFTAVLFALTVSGISLLIRLGVKKGYLVLFLVLTFILVSQFRMQVLNVGMLIPNEIAQEKITGIEQKLLTGKGSATVEGRSDVYGQSFDGFLENFFTGQGSAFKVGGHSYWLDKLSQYGIIGTVPFLFFFILMYKRSLKLQPTSLHYPFKIMFLLTLLFMFFNPYEYLEFYPIIFVYSVVISNYMSVRTNPVVITRKSVTSRIGIVQN